MKKPETVAITHSFSMMIDGQPIPLKRARCTVVNGKVNMYDSQALKRKGFRDKLSTRFYHMRMGDYRDSNGKFAIDDFHAVMSADHYDVKLEFLIRRPNRKFLTSPVCTKPDVDNLIKFVLDAATGILWDDDKKVISVNGIKRYSDTPGTIIHVTWVRNELVDEAVESVQKAI